MADEATTPTNASAEDAAGEPITPAPVGQPAATTSAVQADPDPAPAPAAKSSRRKAKASAAEKVALVMTTSRVPSTEQKYVARGRVALADPDFAARLVEKGWARKATKAEVETHGAAAPTLAEPR